MGISYSRIIIVVPLMLPPKSDLYDGSLIKVQPGACRYIYHPMCHLHDAPGPHAYFHFIHLCNDRANYSLHSLLIVLFESNMARE